MKHYVCVHGHFYQPPRENPWLEQIELQESAYPYHDWNDRINTECYAANAMSRILDGEGRIVRIVNNYSSISFNFGPTLLAWMQEHAPDAYERVIEADAMSADRFSGHGSAMAQAYNHMIMPLANRLDKITQVKWGIADFTSRFGRSPEGMWLPETAVDLQTLDILAEHGIRFTILAPRQAAKVRPLGKSRWSNVKDQHIDATRAYLQRLPSGRDIAVFFYDGPISQSIAFERLLADGTTFASRLADAVPNLEDRACLINIATDGETYGHHHRHGDMALAYALQHLEELDTVDLTNYGEFLERHPPSYEVQIIENSSWSCIHGVERWRGDCGCHTGGHGDWNQQWRGPLRDALDWLRDELAGRFETAASTLLKDPWQARDAYIDVILDRDPANVQQFLNTHAARQLTDEEQSVALQLLELQRNAMLMYTSCGWFFDDLSGIETVQVMQYAGRALYLAQQCFGDDLEPGFLERLEQARSNLTAHGNGRQIYDKWVRPARITLCDVGGHHAISSLFDSNGTSDRQFCFQIDRDDYHLHTSGRAKLAIGKATFTSIITHEAATISFSALHMGDHNLIGNARSHQGDDAYHALVEELTSVFSKGDIPQTIRALDRHFGEDHYTVMSVFRDDQRRILDNILDASLGEVERVYRVIYEDNVPLMRSLSSMGAPLPKVLRMTAEFILNNDLRRAFEGPDPDVQLVKQVFDDTSAWQLELDTAGLSFSLQHAMERLAAKLAEHPGDVHFLEQLDHLALVAQSLPFEVQLWKTQNVYYDLSQAMLQAQREGRIEQVIGHNGQWLSRFQALGEKLHVGVQG